MTSRTKLLIAAAAGLTLSVAVFAMGCGSSSKTAGPAGGGTIAGTSGFTQGAITAFGTIHMGSGAHEKIFHVENAVLKRLDDGVTHTATNDDNVVYRVGMRVEVYHEADSSKAIEVHYMKDLEGPITAKPSATAGATFDVLGVPVLVDGQTHFDDTLGGSGLTLNGLVVGNVIEVSGLYDANGVLHATFIEGRHATAAGRTFEIKGTISGLTGTAPNQSFSVNGAAFTTNSATSMHDMVSALTNGLFVEVKTAGTVEPFLATQIEPMTGDFDNAEHEVRGANEASVEGFVTGLTGTSPNFSFTLAGVSVTTSSATTAGLGLVTANAHIEAEGPVSATGVIQAVKITPRP